MFEIKVSIVVIIVVTVFVLIVTPANKRPNQNKSPKHRRYNNSPPPKSLPWFDKDYLKRMEEEKHKYFWDD